MSANADVSTQISENDCSLAGTTTDAPDEIITSAVKPVATTPAPTTPVNVTIKYAPYVKPVSGTLDLCCIGLKWLDNDGASLSSVNNSCKYTAQVYRNLSNGQFTFNPTAKIIAVNQKRKPSNINAAEKEAKAKANASRKSGTYDIFAIVNNNAKDYSNAGGNTAHLKGTLGRDFLHEVGHLRPFSLGHSGVYDDKGNLLAYNDGSSFMGKFGSDKLTAPQLYHLGWLPQKKVGLFELDAPTTEYTFEPLFSKTTDSSVKAVMVPLQGRPLFVSFIPYHDKKKNKTTNVFALHLQSGGGSQRVNQLFGQTSEYKGYKFERTSDDPTRPTMRISKTSTN